MEKTIVIQKKKRPVFLITVFLLAIGAAACWLLLDVLFPRLPGFLDFKITAITVIVAAIGFAIVTTWKQCLSKKPGLIIDDKGLTDHSNMLSPGFIPWGEIISIKTAEGDFKRPLIVVMVNNPDAFLNKKPKMRASLEYQYRQYGSPIVINPAILECDVQQLIEWLNESRGIEN